jgi:histone acetyltransferase 1
LATYFSINSSAQIDLPNTRPEEFKSKFTDLLVPGFYDNYETFMHQVKLDQTAFKPMGDKMGQYELDGCVFEFYHCTLSTPRFKEYHRRLQLFLLWFIEGSSFIDENDDRWEIMLLFKKVVNGKGDSEYSIIGYSTYYPFYHHPDQILTRIRY